MYCNIEDKFLGKKLDGMFYEQNRNIMSNIVGSRDFVSWFGDGRKDVDGNPVIDEALSFTNEKGEKKTIFDFGPISLHDRGEAFKLVGSLPGIRVYDGELFINNTATNAAGSFTARAAVQGMNVINYYYPGLLSVDTYQRRGLSPFSKSQAIPLPIVRVNDTSFQKASTLFSIYNTDLVDTGKNRFDQIRSVDELASLHNTVGEYRQYGVDQATLMDIVEKPEVSKSTYDKLSEFFLKLDPKANIQEVKNLSTAGAAYIQQFLIELDTNAKYQAMPEEVSHFFVEMLPLDSPLRKEMMDNITSFLIYKTTLDTYKGRKEYQKENGNPDYDKIKREASAKLIGEFIYAQAEGDNVRLETLLRVNDNFIKRWWDKLVNLLKRALNIAKRERFQAYIEAADEILKGKIDYLSTEEIFRDANNDVFFLLSDKNKVDIEMTKHILLSVTKAGKLGDLQKVIDNFRNNLRVNYIKIIKEDGFQRLNMELSKDEKGNNTDINYLSELYDVVKKVDVTDKGVNNMLASENQILNFSQFIYVIQNMDNVAKAIDTLVDTYTNEGKLESIAELQSFRDIYTNLESFISNDLATVLADSEVEFEAISKLKEATVVFDTVELKILKKLRAAFNSFFKDRLAPFNNKILSEYTKDIEKSFIYRVQNPAIQQSILLATKQLENNIKDGMSVAEAKRTMMTTLKDANVPDKVLRSALIGELFDQLNNLYTTDKAISNFLSGMGRDIDPLSSATHWVTAGIKNHDMIVASVAKYIVDRRSEGQHMAYIANKDFANKVSPIINQLKTMGMNEYTAGEAITYVDTVVDRSTDKETGELLYKDGVRKVVRLLNPTLGSAEVTKRDLLRVKTEALKKWQVDPNAPEAEALKEAWKVARRNYVNFLDTYYNSPYNKELTDFQKKWNTDEDFLEIKSDWDILSESIRGLLDVYESDKNDKNAYDDYLIKIRERAQLLRTEGKNPEDLKKTQLLQQFFDESSKFRVEDARRTQRNYTAALNNYESKIDYAIGTFLRKNQKDLDTLETTLREVMKDNSINIKYQYMYDTAEVDSVSSDSVSSDLEVAYVKAILLDRFEQRNKVKVKTDHYYDVQKKVYEEIDALKKKGGLSSMDEVVSDLYKEISDLLVGKGDFYGQRNPDSLSPAELDQFQGLEDRLAAIRRYNVRTYKITDEVKAKKAFAQYLPLIQEYERLISDVQDTISGKKTFDANQMESDKKDISDLNKIFEANGIVTKEQKDISQEIRDLYIELGQMSEKQPTEVYWDKMEDLLPIIESLLQDKIFQRGNAGSQSQATQIRLDQEIANLTRLLTGRDPNKNNSGYGGLMDAINGRNHELLDKIINDEYFVNDGQTPVEFSKYVDVNEVTDTSQLEEVNPEFFDWFVKSHKMDKVWVNDMDPFTGRKLDTGAYQERMYVRRLYYTYSEPVKEELAGKKLYEQKYGKRYRATKINDDPETGFFNKKVSWKDNKNMEDWTVDNKDDNQQYLPLSRKQMAEQGKTDGKYLNKAYYSLKDATDKKSTLLTSYLDQSISTYFGEQENKPDNLKSLFNLPVTNIDHYQKMREDVRNAPDRVKRIGQKIASPFKKAEDIDAEDQLTGLDDIKDIDEYSQEVIKKVENRMPALGMNVKLPVERVNRNVLHAIQEYINHSRDYDNRADLNPFVKGLIDVMKANEELGRRSQEKRADIFDKIYSQMILQELPDNVTNSRFFRKMTGILLSMTGVKLMADMVGGGINYLQANINNILESFASKYASPKNYAVGLRLATQMVGEIFIDYNKKDNFNYMTMLYQHFDFVQGEMQEDIAARSSKINKLTDIRNILMLPRKNGELHAQSAMALAILDNKKVPNTIDGKNYPMWNIYKKEGNNLVLKEGFDKALYNPVDGTEFWRIKKLIWSVNIDLHGNYSRLNQTEASRHSVGKMAENMKRWFVSNLQRRFGRETMDVNKAELDQGYYNTPSLMVYSMVRELLKRNLQESRSYFNYYWTTPRKSQNLRRAGGDVVILVGLFMLASFLGYNYNDPDKNKKLKENSWVHNELILLFLRTYAEHTAFIPVPPFGFTEMTRNLLDPFSVAKSALGNAAGALSTLIYTIGYELGINDEKDAFYTRDSGSKIGKKGNSKFLTYLAKVFGYNGSSLDPAFYIRNFEQLQNRLK